MEGIKNNAPESPKSAEQLSGKEKLEQVLALFGTDMAREAFVETCKAYIEARDKAVRESYAPQVSVRSRAVISSPKQSIFHNKIMDTLTRIASQSLNISPLQSDILREMHNRDITAQIVREYVSSIDKTVEEDEEELGGRKKGMSDTAYYHSLGKEH